MLEDSILYGFAEAVPMHGQLKTEELNRATKLMNYTCQVHVYIFKEVYVCIQTCI